MSISFKILPRGTAELGAAILDGISMAADHLWPMEAAQRAMAAHAAFGAEQLAEREADEEVAEELAYTFNELYGNWGDTDVAQAEPLAEWEQELLDAATAKAEHEDERWLAKMRAGEEQRIRHIVREEIDEIAREALAATLSTETGHDHGLSAAAEMFPQHRTAPAVPGDRPESEFPFFADSGRPTSELLLDAALGLERWLGGMPPDDCAHFRPRRLIDKLHDRAAAFQAIEDQE